MFLADTNFWIALVIEEHQFHDAAGDWFAKQKIRKSVLFCRSTQQSFLRLLTMEAVTRRFGIPPMTNTAAWTVYEGIRMDERIGFAEEPGSIESRWKKYAGGKSASPKLWMDAYLAAFAMAGGLEFLTSDKAFKQFEGLQTIIFAGE